MALPESAQGALLDVRNQLSFRLDVTVTTLVLYAEDGSTLARIDHWWHLGKPKRQGQSMVRSQRLEVLEDGTPLEAFMKAVKTVRYEVPDGSSPVPLSPVYQVELAEDPDPGRNRLWVLKATKPEIKGRFFQPPGRK